MANSQNIRIIVAPLDWGMGHATRCIPVIKELQRRGVTVVIAGTKASRERIAASGIEVGEIDLPGYDVRYHRSLPAWVSVIFQMPRIRRAIRSEKKILSGYLHENAVDAIISDNRYGISHPGIFSVMITHQLQPVAPVKAFQFIINNVIKNLLKNFDETWIPDVPDEKSISGELSVSRPIKTIRHIGLLSRFDRVKPAVPSGERVLAIISGPEPQVEIFRRSLIRLAIHKKIRMVIVAPSAMPLSHGLSEEWIRFVHLPDDAGFQTLVAESRYIIMRPGYSGIMDMVALGRTALLIPTPGQTEQEYLAGRMRTFGFTTVSQRNILKIDFPGSFPVDQVLEVTETPFLLENAVTFLLERIPVKS